MLNDAHGCAVFCWMGALFSDKKMGEFTIKKDFLFLYINIISSYGLSGVKSKIALFRELFNISL